MEKVLSISYLVFEAIKMSFFTIFINLKLQKNIKDQAHKNASSQ